MNVERAVTVHAPRARVWPVVCDLRNLGACVPDVSAPDASADRASATARVDVASTTLELHGVAEVVERDPAGHRVVLRLAARDALDRNVVDALLTIGLTAAGDATEMSVAGRVRAVGPIAMLGHGHLGRAGDALVAGTAERLAAQALRSADAATPPRTPDEPEPVAGTDRRVPVVAALTATALAGVAVAVARRRRRRAGAADARRS